MSTTMKDHALAYAARGWPVFPLHEALTFGPKVGEDRATCSCRRDDCQNQGKHPRLANGLHGASTDPATVAGWWERWPTANIGIATGVAFDVLDLDGPDSLDSLDAAQPEASAIVGPMVVTGRGIHVYLSPTGAGNRTGMLPGVDWRGRGGYVVAPPSLHHLYGDRYEWGTLYGIDTALSAPPDWLAALVHKQTATGPQKATQRLSGAASRYGTRAMESELARLATAPEGTRNDALNTAAYSLGQLVAGGELDAGLVAGALLTVALRIGLSEHEALATIRSGMTSGARSPRRGEVRS